MRCKTCAATIMLLALLVIAGSTGWGQEILLDKSVKAGQLTLFQAFSDPKTYYYVPDKMSLGTAEDGKPQFSFLKFVKNVAPKPGEAESDEGEGGGIVHCLVQLGVNQDLLAEARSELRRQVPDAKIAGPIIFKSGKFGIVSSFKEENGEWATKVVGLGNAPILDGEKAAVSIRLTKLGASILWQSFKTAAPDISFTFEMEMAGYRNPYEATLEAEWEKIYSHKDLSIGFASKYLGFQIRDIYDELRDTGAIKLVVKGEDARMDTLIGQAYGKICDAMFDKIQASASEQSGATSMLDRASQYLRDRQQTSASSSRSTMLPAYGPIYSRRGLGDGETSTETRETPPANESGSTESRETPPADQGGSQSGTTMPNPFDEQTTSGTAERPATSDRPGTDVSAPESQPNRPAATAAEDDQEPQRARDPFRPHQGSRVRDRRDSNGQNQASARNNGQRSQPSFSLLASYTIKKEKRTGKFTYSFKKYTSDTLQLRFDENIGNLSRLMSDKRHFFEVNLDDPVFKQREISVYLDGQNSADFANYVNYVTVRLRKTHEAGAQTNDEIRIDRSNFAQNGNFFRLMYGWKDDRNRDKWMDYDVNTVWSFHGGKEVDMGWQKANGYAITVTPPHLKRTIHLEADPSTIQEAGVRLITVKFYYDIAGVEQSKQVTLNPASSQLSQTLEYIRPADQLQYGYEISWRLKSGQTVTSGRKTSSDDFIFCDELPGKTVSMNGGGRS